MTTSDDYYSVWNKAWLRCGNGLVGALLVVMVLVAIRSHLIGDGRGGWSMYNHNVQFIVVYEWEMSDGTRQTYFPGSELRGRENELRMKPITANKLTPNNQRYGLWTLKSHIRGYLRHLFEKKKPKEAVAIIATLRYAVDQHLKIGDEIPYNDPVLGPQFYLPEDFETNQTVVVFREGAAAKK